MRTITSAPDKTLRRRTPFNESTDRAVRSLVSNWSGDFLVRRHGWVWVLIIGLWAAAGSYVLTQKDVAVEHPAEPTQSPLANMALMLGKPKDITYEALSRSNAEVTVSYLDETGQAKLYIGASPWSMTVKTSDIGFAAGVTAVSVDGPLTCRISVDGRLADEKTDAGTRPSVSCSLLAFRKATG